LTFLGVGKGRVLKGVPATLGFMQQPILHLHLFSANRKVAVGTGFPIYHYAFAGLCLERCVMCAASCINARICWKRKFVSVGMLDYDSLYDDVNRWGVKYPALL
jgi:hypothetical protein